MKGKSAPELISLIILLAGLFFLLPKEHEEEPSLSFADVRQDIMQRIGALGIVDVNAQTPGQWCGDYPCFSARDFVEAYERFEDDMGFTVPSKYILNHTNADDYIRLRAEMRGYVQRPFADESRLVEIEGHRTQVELKNAYIHMRDAMQKEGIRLHFVSGYRSSTDQRDIFRNKLGDIDLDSITDGSYDGLLDTVLEVSSIPGYSKHHSGYAVDFACGNDYLVYEFSETECYAWMSKNNFERTKVYGFIPSYPEDLVDQGPRPEPWEFVWVPQEYLQ